MSDTLSPEATRFLEILWNVRPELSGLQQSIIMHNLRILDRAFTRAREEREEALAEIRSMRSMQQRINQDRETIEARHINELGALRAEMERERKKAASHLRDVDHRLSALRHRYRSGILAREMVKRIELERRRLARENQSLRAQLSVLNAEHVDLTELRDDMEEMHKRLGTLLGLSSNPDDDYDEYDDE